MITVFNRKELTTTHSDQRLYAIKGALDEAGISYKTKANLSFFTADRYRGMPCINSDATHPTVIYVKKSDFDRANEVLRKAL